MSVNSVLPVAKVKGTMKVRHLEVAAIKEKVQDIIKDKKKANAILDVVAGLESEDATLVTASVLGLASIFTHHIKEREMFMDSVIDNNQNVGERSVEQKYKLWLREIYSDVVSRLAGLCVEAKPKTQELALSTLIKFLALEGKNPLNKVSADKVYFPCNLLEKIVLAMLSKVVDTKNVVSRFEEYLEYSEVKFHTLKILSNLFKSSKSHASQEIYLYNCFNLMKSITLPKSEAEAHEYLIKREDASQFKFDLQVARKLFGVAWLNFLKVKLPATLHRRILLILDQKVLVYMDNPLLLTDFLMDSYSLGGVYKILALNGIFVLMQKHNLEFPDFYTNLYSLLDESVFHTKYCPRFFFLAHIFLSSTHLPEYLVAAFVKRFARLSLTAPPNAAMLLVAFITNLMIRHRSLVKLAHNPNGPKDITEDPYIMEEADMSRCRANESSLWEMQTLQHHINPRVAFAAKFVDKPLPRLEVDVTQFLELTISEMITIESKKKAKRDAPMTFSKPMSLFGGDDVFMQDLWCL